VTEATVNGTVVSKPMRNKATGRFLPGHKSIGGRKRGSRNLLSEQFLSDLHAEWKRSGKAVLESVAKEEPATFLKVVAGVMPRLIDIDAAVSVNGNVDMNLLADVRDFKTAYEAWGKHIGVRGLPMIEAEVIENEELVEAEDEQSPSDRG
jgi:hypothetical protein